MASSSSTSDNLSNNGEVDDHYFSIMNDDDEIFPISDEKYAEELQLQEAILASYESPNLHESLKNKQPLVSSPESSQNSYCGICMDSKTESEMFANTNVCGHIFCSECICSHIAAKIKDNIVNVKCPVPECEGLIGPEMCRSIVPKQVLERWEDALCESLILASERFYCPFKDCSAMLVDDGCGNGVTSSECPNCNRLFCAQCKVAWHSGLDCSEYNRLSVGERDPQDIVLMELAKNKKWRRCPKCRFYVEKTSGCLHIKCRCGFDFCYGCGQDYDSSHACASASS